MDAVSNWLAANAVGLLVGVLSTVVIALVKPIRDRAWRWFSQSIKWYWAAIRALPEFLKLRSFVLKQKPLWSYRTSSRTHVSNHPPVITIMNFKGGVGKTTIAANLAASLSERRGLCVLLIDLDYQGSLSDLLLTRSETAENQNLLNEWLQKPKPSHRIEDLSTEASGLENTRLVSAEYELTEAEDNQLLRWLLGETSDDVRSRIFRRLRNSRDSKRLEFDVVIMDAPPRLSLASVNALKASDYILVPTKLQPLSVVPIAKMIRQLKTFKDQTRSSFKLLGVICNMTSKENGTSGSEKISHKSITDSLKESEDAPVIFGQFVPDRAIIGRPGDAPIGYLSSTPDGQVARRIFDNLSSEIADKIGLPVGVANAAE